MFALALTAALAAGVAGTLYYVHNRRSTKAAAQLVENEAITAASKAASAVGAAVGTTTLPQHTGVN